MRYILDVFKQVTAADTGIKLNVLQQVDAFA